MKTLRTFFILTLTITAIAGFSFSGTIHAQSIPDAVSTITLSSLPENPAPGQSVTITAVSYVIDINTANLVWVVGGVQKQKGIGATTLTIKAPPLGKTTTVSVGGSLPTGQQISNSIDIKSGEIDMIVETDGYIPPFFLGKILPVYQNVVRIIAIPHLANSSGVEYDPATLVYKWTADTGTVLSDQSGYGRQSIDIPGSLVPRAYSMTVDATTRDGTNQISGTASVIPQAPSLTFYPVDPLYGPLYNRSIGDSLYIGSQKETSVIAAPFGLNYIASATNSILRSWMINDVDHPELDSGDIVVLRAPDGASGSSNITLTMSSQNNILQRLSGAFTANFQ